MGTLKSLVKLKEVHRRMMAEGRLGQHMQLPPRSPSERKAAQTARSPSRYCRSVSWPDTEALPELTREEYATAIGEGVVELIGSYERVVSSRISLARQGRPLAGKPAQPPGNYGDPTPERAVKAVEGMEAHTMGRGAQVPVRRYRVRHPVESYKDHFDFANQRALEAMMADSDHATRVNITANYEREGIRTAPGSKIGGLGNVPTAVRNAHARFFWVYDRLPTGLQATLKALVLQERTNDGTVLSMEKFGERLFPEIKDRATRKGISLGALWALSEQLVQLRRMCPFRNTEEHEAVKGSDVSRDAIARRSR